MTDGRLAWIIIVAILLIDQIIKIEVKTTMCLGESIRLTDWFYINFIENKGMAYGMSFMPKILLSTLRIIAICFIGWYISLAIRKKARTLYVVLLSMIVAGAAGNVIDCMFYGLIFNSSSPYYISYSFTKSFSYTLHILAAEQKHHHHTNTNASISKVEYW
jgi:signal peptidase II